MVISRVVVAICTHNPDLKKLARVLHALEQNDGNFRILLINNASSSDRFPSIIQSKKMIVLTEEKLGNLETPMLENWPSIIAKRMSCSSSWMTITTLLLTTFRQR